MGAKHAYSVVTGGDNTSQVIGNKVYRGVKSTIGYQNVSARNIAEDQSVAHRETFLGTEAAVVTFAGIGTASPEDYATLEKYGKEKNIIVDKSPVPQISDRSIKFLVSNATRENLNDMHDLAPKVHYHGHIICHGLLTGEKASVNPRTDPVIKTVLNSSGEKSKVSLK